MQKRQPVTSFDSMTVFQEDFEIMSGYTHEQVVQYIANAEQSLKSIDENTIPEAGEYITGDPNLSKEFYKKPFTLITSMNPSATYYRFSLVPYDESIKEEFKDVQHDIGNYIKTDYDYINDVKYCLATYHGYLKALERNFQEGVSHHAESFINDYDEFFAITREGNKADLQSVKNLHDNQDFHPILLENAAKGQIPNNNTELIEFFLQNGAEPTNRLVECAAESSSQEMMELLSKYGADIHANSEAALRTACSHGNADIAKYLIEHEANLEAPHEAHRNQEGEEEDYNEEKIGIICLDNAVSNNNKEVVEILLDRGVDIDEGIYQPALATSIQRGHYDMAEFLLNRGADHQLALEKMGHRGGVVLPEAKENEQTENPKLAQLRQMLRGKEEKLDAETKRNIDWLLDTVGKIQLAQTLDAKLPGKTETKPSFSDMVKSATQQPQTQVGRRKL